MTSGTVIAGTLMAVVGASLAGYLLGYDARQTEDTLVRQARSVLVPATAELYRELDESRVYHVRPEKIENGGVVLEEINTATLVPLVDYYGELVGYRQEIEGRPWVLIPNRDLYFEPRDKAAAAK